MRRRWKLITKLSSLLVISSLLAFGAVGMTPEKAHATEFRSSFGTEFWTSFGNLVTPDDKMEFFITLSSIEDASVEIHWPDKNASTTTIETISVPAGTAVDSSIKKPSQIQTTGLSQSWVETQEIVQSGVKIISDVPVSAYAVSQSTQGSADASILYPTSYLGTEYRAISMGHSPDSNLTYGDIDSASTEYTFLPNGCWQRVTNISDDPFDESICKFVLGDRVDITAVEDGTQITITPTDDINAVGDLGQCLAGTACTVNLDQGQTYSVSMKHRNIRTIDGSLISSNKKVAVQTAMYFQGHNFGDIMIDAIAPTDTWGKSFLLPMTDNTFRTKTNLSDLFFIMANEDNTTVTINGTDQTPIDAGERIVFQPTDEGREVADGDNTPWDVELISSDKPIAVMQVVDEGSFSGFSSGRGDPSNVMMIPTNQFLNDMVVSTTGVMDLFSIVIVAKKADKSDVSFDGTNLSPSDFTDIGTTDYAVSRQRLNSSQGGSYRISAPEGLAVYVYGAGNNVSHAFAGATGLVDLVANPGGTAEVGFRSLEQITTFLNTPPPSSSAAPAPYTGPLVTSVGAEQTAGAFQTTSSATVTVYGERLSGVSKVFIEGKEAVISSTSNDSFVMTLPAGLSDGVHDLVIQSSLGNLTYLDGLSISGETVQITSYGEVSAWTSRISDSQIKVYVKFPTVGEKVRISHQVGGSGDYNTVYVKTTSSETMDGLRIVEGVGTYVVRTIDLEEINRIRVTVGDEELVQVRYNN